MCNPVKRVMVVYMKPTSAVIEDLYCAAAVLSYFRERGFIFPSFFIPLPYGLSFIIRSFFHTERPWLLKLGPILGLAASAVTLWLAGAFWRDLIRVRVAWEGAQGQEPR